MNELYIYISNSLNVYYNLAYEQEIIRICPKDAFIIFLWRNDNCVVIGANQNAYSQVNLSALSLYKSLVARRSSGGGAVYHDKNNLNFSFICNKEYFSISSNFQIIINALKQLGLNAQISGRNDLTVEGSKFSGNAFLYKTDIFLHHGTILIDTDTNIMSQLLTVDNAKLTAHSVDSIKSRVVNLKSLVDIDCQRLSQLIIDSASQIFGLKPSIPDDSFINKDNIQETYNLISSHEYIFKKFTRLPYSIKSRLEIGMIEIFYNLQQDIIIDAEVYTDSLDVAIAGSIENQLKGISIYSDNCNDLINQILKLIINRQT